MSASLAGIGQERRSWIVPSIPFATCVTELGFLVIRRCRCSDEQDTTTREPSYPEMDDMELIKIPGVRVLTWGRLNGHRDWMSS